MTRQKEALMFAQDPKTGDLFLLPNLLYDTMGGFASKFHLRPGLSLTEIVLLSFTQAYLLFNARDKSMSLDVGITDILVGDVKILEVIASDKQRNQYLRINLPDFPFLEVNAVTQYFAEINRLICEAWEKEEEKREALIQAKKILQDREMYIAYTDKQTVLLNKQHRIVFTTLPKESINGEADIQAARFILQEEIALRKNLLDTLGGPILDSPEASPAP